MRILPAFRALSHESGASCLDRGLTASWPADTELPTVFPLSYTVLDPPPLHRIRDLGPILVWVYGTVGTVIGYVSGGRSRRGKVATSWHAG